MDSNELSENLKLVDLPACRIADQDGYDLVVKAVNSLLQILRPGDFPSRLLNALMDFADTTPIKKDELSPSDPILPPTLSPTMVAVQRTARAIDERTIGTGHRSFVGQCPVSHHAPPPYRAPFARRPKFVVLSCAPYSWVSKAYACGICSKSKK